MKNIKSPYMSIIGWGMFLTGALMFASCADDDIIESTAVTTGDAICFSASKTRNMWEPDQTRSASSKEKQTLHCEAADGDFSVDVTVEDGIRSYESSQQVHSRGTQISEVGGWSYKVGAYYFFDESVQDESGTSIDFFSENSSGGLKINTDNNKNNAAVTTPYYWPPVGEMKFFAVAPAEVAEATEATFKIPALANVNTPTLTYTIPSNVAEQKDIMVAQSTVACQTNNSSVDLQFEHLLAAVQFKVGNMQFIKINSITVSGVIGGTITMTYNATNDVWTYVGTEENAIYSPTSMEVPALAPKGTEITGNENKSMLLVMPQIPGENAKITVNYTELLTGKTTDSNPASIAAKVVDGVTVGAWEAGKTTVYSLNIGTTFDVEIPDPSNQDAHYILLDMPYKLNAYSEYIQSVTATAEWIEDNSQSSKNGISLKDTLDLTPTQHQGYWTDQDWKLIYSVDEDGNIFDENGNESIDSEGNPKIPDPVLVNNNTRGGNKLPLNGLKGTIMLFIEENNGIKPRTGKLTLTATFKDNNIAPMVIGEQEFIQYCPSWNGTDAGSLGVERIEDGEKHPFGFNYDRTVTYKNSGLTAIGHLLYGWVATWYVSESDFIKFDRQEREGFLIGKYSYIANIILDYSSLNEVESVADDSEGFENTNSLYEFTGGASFEDTEKSLNDLWGFNDGVSNESKLPEDYAAYVALSCNRMRQLYKKITPIGQGEPTESTTAILHEENGKNIIEWYLPSTTEAQTLVETSAGGENQPTPLNGEYWSSNAGSDEDLKAHSYTYTNNKYGSINTTKDRMEKLKVRAVRKKP